MILLSLTLRNFRQHAESRIEFGPGLTGIIGANGAGKSTILEAVGYALYGTAAIRGNKDGLRWHGAPARHQAEVVLDFALSGQRYRVVRSETTAHLLAVLGGGGHTATVADGTSAVNARIPELLGLSWPEFAATYLCPQKALGLLAGMGTAERSAFFRRVLGVERADAATAEARRAASDLRRERAGVAAGLGDRAPLAESALEAAALAWVAANTSAAAVDAAAEAVEALDALEAGLLKSESRRAQHERLSREREQAQRDLNAALREVERLKAEILAAQASTARLAETEAVVAGLPGLRTRRDTILRAQANEERRGALLRTIRETEHRVREAQARIAAYDEAAHRQAAKELSEQGGQVEALREARAFLTAEAEAERKQSEVDATRLARRRAALAEATGPVCPTCGQPLAERLAVVLADMDAEAETRTAHLAALANRIRYLSAPAKTEADAEARRVRCQAEVSEHETRAGSAARARHLHDTEYTPRLAQARAEMSAHDADAFDAGALREVEAQIAEAEALDRELAVDRVRAAQAEMLGREYGNALLVRDGVEAHVGTLCEMLRTLAFDPAEHARLATAVTGARSARDDAAVTLARAEAEARSAADRLARAQAALAEYDRRALTLNALNERLAVQAAAAEALDAFRRAVAARIRPEMEETVSGFVAILTDGRFEAASIDESFSVTLYAGGIAKPIVSGGEEDVVALALRMAVAELIAQRAGHDVGCLILDEPLPSLDAVRRENVLGLLRRLESRYPQVLLVSHFPEIQHAAAQVVMVDLDADGQRSRVSQSGVEVAAW